MSTINPAKEGKKRICIISFIIFTNILNKHHSISNPARVYQIIKSLLTLFTSISPFFKTEKSRFLELTEGIIPFRSTD